MTPRAKAVRFENGHGREWWQIAVRCGRWWWPTWRWVPCYTVNARTATIVGSAPMEWTTREEAMEALREVRGALRSTDVRRVEEVT
jgi:hypothetical protein